MSECRAAATVSGHPLTARSLINGERITVKLGRDENARDFLVPKTLLLKRSSWFARVLADGQHCELTGVVDLPYDDPTVFEAFVYWLYHDDLSFESISENIMAVDALLQLKYAFQIWLFGGRYVISGLQNCAMLRACEILKSVDLELPNDVLRNCFDLTAERSPLRNIAVDYMVTQIARHHVPIAHFHTVTAALDTSGTEALLQTLQHYHCYFRNAVKEFPRYLKPMKYRPFFYVERAAEEPGFSVKDNEVGNGYSNWSEFKASCEDCGLFLGERVCLKCWFTHCACADAQRKTLCPKCAGPL